MSENDISRLSNCREVIVQIINLTSQRNAIIGEYNKFKGSKENDVDTMGIIAVIACIAIVIMGLANGFSFIGSLIVGVIVAAVVDIPFKFIRKRRSNRDISSGEADTNARISDIDAKISALCQNEDYIFIKNAVTDLYLNLDCIDYITNLLITGQSSDIPAALKKYIADKQAQAEQEAKRKAEQEAARQKAEQEAARRKAEQEAQRKAEQEAQRKAAQEAARQKAEQEARQRAEQEAQQKAARNSNSNGNSKVDYFAGCNDMATLAARYKQLAKCYHPDTGIGDEETMKAINEQYDALKKKFE